MRGVRWTLTSALVSVALVLAVAATAAQADPVAMGGDPMTVYVDSLGQCQSSYASTGGNYFPGDNNTGDCGFFLSTPSQPADQPSELDGQVFGFDGTAGPDGVNSYTPVSQGDVTGDGSAASPFELVTVYDVDGPSSADTLLQVTQTTAYVSGDTYFTAYYDVANVTNQLDPSDANYNSAVYFRAIYAGDLFVGGDDHGMGVFSAGPPRFIGGQNPTSGVIGGFQEQLTYLDGSPVPPWSSYAEDYWNDTTANGPDEGIWYDVENSADASPPFPNSVSPTLWDNGAGVAWDTDYTTGLAPGADQKFAIVNSTAVPVIGAPGPVVPTGGAPSPSRPQPARNPCAATGGSFGSRVLASLKCTAELTKDEVKCGSAIAFNVILPTKLLRLAKTADGFINLAKLPRGERPIARLYDDIQHAKFLPHAPKGFRTFHDIVSKLAHAHTVAQMAADLIEIKDHVSPASFRQISDDIVEIAGLGSCIKAVVDATA